MRYLPAIPIYGYVGGEVGLETLFLGQSIGIDDTFQLKFVF